MAGTYLSRLTLRRDAQTVAPLLDVLNPSGEGSRVNVDHRLLWTMMPQNIRDAANARPQEERGVSFLWRRETSQGRFFVLGPEPERDSPFFRVESKPFEPALQAGDALSFDLRVNATVNRKVGEASDGKALRKRVDVAMDLMFHEKKVHAASAGKGWYGSHRQEMAQKAAESWLIEQGGRNGFRVSSLVVCGYQSIRVPRAGAKAANFGVFDLKGQVVVGDPVAFLDRLYAGFGRAKAFGCGLMLIRRAT